MPMFSLPSAPMPMFSLPSAPIRPRLSWGKNSSTTSAKRKRTVRFSRQRPEIIQSDYEITESIQKVLWYRRKDMMAIRMKVEQHVHKAVMGCDEGHCHRGLEALISDRSSPSQSRQHRLQNFTRGLLVLQASQAKQGVTDPEELRKYCLDRGSKHQQSCAKVLAKEDAIAALQIHEASLLWKIPHRSGLLVSRKRKSAAKPPSCTSSDDIFPPRQQRLTTRSSSQQTAASRAA